MTTYDLLRILASLLAMTQTILFASLFPAPLFWWAELSLLLGVAFGVWLNFRGSENTWLRLEDLRPKPVEFPPDPPQRTKVADVIDRHDFDLIGTKTKKEKQPHDIYC